MGGITPKEDNKRGSAGLSSCALQVINACLKEGADSGSEYVLIKTPKEDITKELFDKRKLVLDYLFEAGYTAVVSEFDTDLINNGWHLHNRAIETVPEKLMTGGRPLHVRAELGAKSYKLWVYL